MTRTVRVRIVGRARAMFYPRRNTRADRWPRARNVPPAPQYARGSLAAREECSARAAIRVRIVGRARGMFSPRRNTRADRWLRARNGPPAPQYACGSLAARAECPPRAAIRVRIVGCARGMFSPRRNTRADRWLRARNVPAHAAIRVRIVGCARGMLSPRCNTRADRWLRARNVLPASQYACWSLAAP